MANTIYDALAEGLIPQPVTLIDLAGAPYVATGGGGGGTVNIADPTTPAQKMAVDATGKIGINNFPNLQLDGSGNLKVNIQVGGSGGSAGTAATSDGIAASSINELGMAVYNGTTFDRLKGDTGAARTSLYGKYSAAGDTPIGVDAAGNLGIRNFPYKFDASGNLLTNSFSPGYIANSGGPLTSAGVPSGFGFDLQKGLQGKGTSGVLTITTTVANDTTLTFASAPLNLAPGAPIYLAVTTGAPTEVVYASNSWVPGTGNTVVSLQNPVRYAGQNRAFYDTYAPTGPQFNGMSPAGIMPSAVTYWNPQGGNNLQHELVRGSNGWMAQQNYIDYMILQQAGFSVDTGVQGPTSAAGTFPINVFNNTKNLIIYSIVLNCTVPGTVRVTSVGANPAYGTTLTPFNAYAGGNTAGSIATMTATTTTFAGTSIYSLPFSQAQLLEILPNGKKFFIPGYAAKGLTIWITTGASISQWSATITYLEY